MCAEKAARPPRFLCVRAGARLLARAASERAEPACQFEDVRVRVVVCRCAGGRCRERMQKTTRWRVVFLAHALGSALFWRVRELLTLRGGLPECLCNLSVVWGLLKKEKE